MGQSVIVPILLRSLAESIALLKENEFPIGVNPDFLLTLDSDLSVQHDSCAIVDVYECAWWKKPIKEGSLKSARVLDHSSIDKCIETHLKQIPSTIPTLATNADDPHLGTEAINSRRCPQCNQYRQILSNTLQDLLEIQQFSSSMATSSECQWNIDMRRASTFNLLHEAAVIKEMSTSATSATSATSPTSARTRAERVAVKAKRELTRLQALPTTSYKWTWGERLTDAEVIALHRSGTRPGQMHSGYDTSLRDGKLGSESSAPPSMPVSIDVPSNQHADSSASLPDYQFPAIPFFVKKKNLSYDPLGKSRQLSSHIPQSSALADLTSTNLDFHTEMFAKIRDEEVTPIEGLEDQWRSASDEEAASPRTDIANEWVSQNEENAEDPELGIENEWISASDKEVSPGAADITNDGGKPANDDKPKTPPAEIEDTWSSAGEDKSPAVALDDIWSSESNEDDGNLGPTSMGVENVWESASEEDADGEGVENVWESASEEDADGEADEDNEVAEGEADDAFSSSPPANSNLVVSPSRITVDPLRISFPLSDAWPDLISDDSRGYDLENPVLETPIPLSFRRFGPEDFFYLQDHMFEDSISASEDED
jgi:hypothetical protein